jgi:hypothetical protein
MTMPTEAQSLSEATAALLAAMPSLATRPVFAPTRSATMATAERNEAFRHAEVPALVAASAAGLTEAEDFTVADATEQGQL